MRDVDIRRAVRRQVDDIYQGDRDTLILDELVLCQGTARVDLAVVNGTLHGYEIKSELDTLARLPNQREVYSRVLDRVTIVATSSHLRRVTELVPDWWAIWTASCVTTTVHLHVVRDGKDNPAREPLAIAQLLWREEALRILDSRNLAAGVRSKPRKELWQRLATELTVSELAAAVRERLRQRRDWRVPAQPA
jgi:hypothetical protein